MFQLQVLLCEYREALNSGYYPGASLDEELMYMAKASSFDLNPILESRRALFSHEYLGEISGWSGIRKEKFQPFKGK